MNYKIKSKRKKEPVTEVRVGWDEQTHQVLLAFPMAEARLSAEAAAQIAGQLQAAAKKVEPSRRLLIVGSA